MNSITSPQSPVISTQGFYTQIPTLYRGTSLKISKLNQYLAYSSREGTIVLYDPKTNTTLLDLDLKSGPLWNLDISNDESYIITGGESQKLYLIHIPSQEVIKTFTGHTGDINNCVFSSDSKSVFSTSDDGTARLFDVESGENSVLVNHQKKISAFDLSNDEKYIISGDSSGNIAIKLIELSDVVICCSSHHVWCLKFSYNCIYFVSGNSYGSIEAWDLDGTRIRILQEIHMYRIKCISFANNDFLFASAGDDHLVKIWRSDNWYEEVTFDVHSLWIKSIVYSSHQQTWISIGDDKQIMIIKNPNIQVGLNISETESKVLYIKELNYLLLITGKDLMFYDVLTGDIIKRLKLNKKFESICERSDGNILINFEKSIKVLDIKTLKFLPTEIPKTDFRAILSSNYFYFIYESCLVIHSNTTLEEKFSIPYEGINLVLDKTISVYKTITLIASGRNLNIFNESRLLNSLSFTMEIVEMRIRNSKNFYLITQDHLLFHFCNNKAISELKTNLKFKIGMTLNKKSLFVYDKFTIIEYSFDLEHRKTFEFKTPIKSFLVSDECYVITKEAGLITFYKDLAQTYFINDEKVKARILLKF